MRVWEPAQAAYGYSGPLFIYVETEERQGPRDAGQSGYFVNTAQ